MPDSNGLLVPSAEATLRDYTHASKLFRDDAFRFLPKQANLFHVAFDFSRDIGFGETIAAERIQAGLLVKEVDLPSYKITNKINNAYNRKNIIQSQITYGEVSITFHDDSANLTNAMWQAYYEYYYADSYGRPEEYLVDTKYADRTRLNWGFVPKSKPFFSSIRLYTLSQQKFSGYTLINPLINSWDHGKLNVEDDTPLSNKMGLTFESVLYSHGIIGEDEEPKYFTELHYDNELSPLGDAGGIAPPVSVESSGAEIRSNISIFDQFFDEDYAGGVASIIDGVLSGDGDKLKDSLVSTTINLGSAIIAGDNITDIYNFPAPIAGPLQDVQTILKPVLAVQILLGTRPPGSADFSTTATSNNKTISGGS